MNNIEQVNQMVAGWIREGMPKDQIVVNAGKAEKDWDYVWGATGQRCTVAQRKAFISRQRAKGYEGEAQETIRKCQVLNGSAGSCAGCKFYCDGKGTLIHDCQGFVKEICSRVGITLSGGGSNSMWNNNANWTKKGSIKDMPEQVCCIFWTGKNKDGKIVKSHIGFYIGGGMMVHCSGGVKIEKLSSKCTDYALIKGLGGVVPPVPPVPPPEPVPEGYAEVTGKKVALRKDPSLQANILLRVDTGETVKLEQLPPKEWDYVSYNGKTGWMMREFLREEVNTATVTGKKVALRKDPSKQASIIMRIDTGAVVLLVDEPESEWDYVSYKGSTGYMMKKYLREGADK